MVVADLAHIAHCSFDIWKKYPTDKNVPRFIWWLVGKIYNFCDALHVLS
jgi:hypothetical protein